MNPFAWLNPGRWMLYAALAGALIVGYFAWADHIGDVREAKVLAKIEKQRAAENAKNAQITADWQKGKDDALEKANKRAADLQAAADKLAALNRGLRNELTDQRGKLSTASIAAVRQYATAANLVFGECSAEVERLAKDADGHSSDSLMLQQAWPK
jgi:hypothetical protein